MNNLSKEQRQRVSFLEQMILIKMNRVAKAKPTDYNYQNWVSKLEEYKKEYESLAGKKFELKWIKSIALILSLSYLTSCASWEDPHMTDEQRQKIWQDYRLKSWEDREYWRMR